MTKNRSPSENDDLQKLKEIFASDPPDEWFKQQPDQNASKLEDYIKFIGDQFIAELGTSDDYELSHSEPEPIANNDHNLFIKSIEVWPKPESGISIGANAGREPIDSIIRKTSIGLWELGLSIEDAMSVVDGVKNRIEKECAVYYRFVDGELSRIDESGDIYSGGIITKRCSAYPNEVKRAVTNLNSLCGFHFCLTKTQAEIEPLDLAAKVIEIKDRIFVASQSNYKIALECILGELKKEIEREKERKELRESIRSDDSGPNGTNDEYDPVKRGLTRRKAMMLIDLMVPNTTNTAKADLLFLLVGYNAEKARQFWSTYLSDRTLDKLANDEKEVGEWKTKLEIK